MIWKYRNILKKKEKSKYTYLPYGKSNPRLSNWLPNSHLLPLPLYSHPASNFTSCFPHMKDCYNLCKSLLFPLPYRSAEQTLLDSLSCWLVLYLVTTIKIMSYFLCLLWFFLSSNAMLIFTQKSSHLLNNMWSINRKKRREPETEEHQLQVEPAILSVEVFFLEVWLMLACLLFSKCICLKQG